MSAVERAAAHLAAGRMVLVVDEADADAPGHVVLGAQHATAADVTFLTRRAGGWIGLALSTERCDALGLEVMSLRHEATRDTPFTVTIEAREGVTTGISTADQAHTIRTAADPAKGPADIVVPGHVRPLRARRGGVLERAGHIEAAVDLAQMAGLAPAAVICPVQAADGSIAGLAQLERFATEHRLPTVTIGALIAHRRCHQQTVEHLSARTLSWGGGQAVAHRYRSLSDERRHTALVLGEVAGQSDVLVRVHPACLPGDVLQIGACDCAHKLERAVAMLEAHGSGVLLYLGEDQHGRHAAPAAHDLRDYGTGAQILAALGLSSLRLITDNPKNLHALEGHGLAVTEQIPLREPRGGHTGAARVVFEL